MATEAPQIRPRPPRSGRRGKKGAVVVRAEAVLAAGGEDWVGAETTLREFPPLRAAWAKRGTRAEVVISGRHARRVLHGMVQAGGRELVCVVRERGRGEDVAAALGTLAARRPDTPKLLIWDNAPPHHTRVVRQLAADAGIEIAWLPFRSPELNPCEDLGRQLKRTVAANRAYPSVDDLADRAAARLAGLTAHDIRRDTGLASSKFTWLPT